MQSIPSTIRFATRSAAALSLALLAGAVVIGPAQPAAAAALGQGAAALLDVANDDALIVQVARRGGGGGGGKAARAGGGAKVKGGAKVNVKGGTKVNVKGGTTVRTGGWARPANYHWRPGGAIAAGAAIGVVSAATAAAWAGPAPGPNMCWYYTDQSRRQGFWDVCQKRDRKGVR
jgi:hypothetical protein